MPRTPTIRTTTIGRHRFIIERDPDTDVLAVTEVVSYMNSGDVRTTNVLRLQATTWRQLLPVIAQALNSGRPEDVDRTMRLIEKGAGHLANFAR